MEKSEIIEILNEWNYWDREVPPTIKRDFYDQKIARVLQSSKTTFLSLMRWQVTMWTT